MRTLDRIESKEVSGGGFPEFLIGVLAGSRGYYRLPAIGFALSYGSHTGGAASKWMSSTTYGSFQGTFMESVLPEIMTSFLHANIGYHVGSYYLSDLFSQPQEKSLN